MESSSKVGFIQRKTEQELKNKSNQTAKSDPPPSPASYRRSGKWKNNPRENRTLSPFDEEHY